MDETHRIAITVCGDGGCGESLTATSLFIVARRRTSRESTCERDEWKREDRSWRHDAQIAERSKLIICCGAGKSSITLRLVRSQWTSE